MANNPLELLKLFQGMQKNMGEMQEKLRRVRATGIAGGDMVEVVLNGHLDVIDVKISPEAFDSSDREVLEDLVRAAFSDATRKIKEHLRDEFSAAMGMPLPPGLFGA